MEMILCLWVIIRVTGFYYQITLDTNGRVPIVKVGAYCKVRGTTHFKIMGTHFKSWVSNFSIH